MGLELGLQAQHYFFQIYTTHHKILKCILQEKLYSQTAMAKAEEESDVLSDTISKCSICLLSKDVTVPSPLSLDYEKEECSLHWCFIRDKATILPVLTSGIMLYRKNCPQ